MKRYLYFCVIIFAFALTSCSTLLNTTTQNVEIKSVPPNAKITIDGKKYGTTPQIVNIPRKDNHVVKIELSGYDTYETQLTTKMSAWFWGNALNGFIPGMAIDLITGSMYNLLPGAVNVQLQPAVVTETPKKK